ncbi:hypothetical protein B0T17DRAFT_596357 [Bombardia bombarda]|uniref:Uncharacterized protein n=1 Tax=Bombardia bombarda TaxID=252184 RepID=A0AA39XN42_9PEZI|nr:hypothetical protein B0T17DRAFT_596357 [Bombardia bombarda]
MMTAICFFPFFFLSFIGFPSTTWHRQELGAWSLGGQSVFLLFPLSLSFVLAKWPVALLGLEKVRTYVLDEGGRSRLIAICGYVLLTDLEGHEQSVLGPGSCGGVGGRIPENCGRK